MTQLLEHPGTNALPIHGIEATFSMQLDEAPSRCAEAPRRSTQNAHQPPPPEADRLPPEADRPPPEADRPPREAPPAEAMRPEGQPSPEEAHFETLMIDRCVVMLSEAQDESRIRLKLCDELGNASAPIITRWIEQARQRMVARLKRPREQITAELIAWYQRIVADPQARNNERLRALRCIEELLGLRPTPYPRDPSTTRYARRNDSTFGRDPASSDMAELSPMSTGCRDASQHGATADRHDHQVGHGLNNTGCPTPASDAHANERQAESDGGQQRYQDALMAHLLREEEALMIESDHLGDPEEQAEHLVEAGIEPPAESIHPPRPEEPVEQVAKRRHDLAAQLVDAMSPGGRTVSISGWQQIEEAKMLDEMLEAQGDPHLHWRPDERLLERSPVYRQSPAMNPHNTHLEPTKLDSS
ncbi:MAG: hypothetical protein JJU36_05115 [Phycisphaeraceae bacterium]|nr:hypothetical protein [Phycisphaeraceae bacterium]